MYICDGRNAFVQWDVNIKITDKDLKVGDEIHFCNRTKECALVVKAYQFDDKVVADVPNILLTKPFPIRVYRYVTADGSTYSITEQIFEVIARSKPDDYVYTQTEILCYASLDKRIKALEAGGGGGGISPTVNITPIEGGHRVTITDINGEQSLDIMNGNDYILTEEDKAEIVNTVLESLESDIGSALDELHSYAQNIVSGGES